MNNIQQELIRASFIGLTVLAFDAQALEPTSSTTPTYANTQKILRQAILQGMKKNKIVGLSIALVDDQTVVWAEGFGYADKAKKVRATPETLYRAGSISKLFTATAAMQLTEQGKFNIDQPLQTYLPEFSIKTRFSGAESITPRQLMTHHSGLPSDYFKGFFVATAPPESLAQLVDKLSVEYTAYPPNLILSYSNLGVSLLGHAVERSCGLAFSICLENNLLQPLGMANSEFSAGSSASSLMSKGYSEGAAVPEPYLRDIPAGGLNTNVSDLSRFVRMVFANGMVDGKPVLSSATLAEMLRPQNTGIPLDMDTQIGLAWFLDRTATGETVASHGGSIGNFNSYLSTLPKAKIGVIVLTNSSGGAGVTNQLAENALQAMLAEKPGNFAQPPANAQPAISTSGNLQNFAGYYASENFGLIGITEKNGHMRIKVSGKSLPIKSNTDDSVRFRLPKIGEVTLSRANLSEREVLIAESQVTGKLLAGEKIAQTPLSKSWRQRVGKYEVTNGGTDVGSPKFMRLSMKNGFLVVSTKGFIDRVLTPVTSTEAIIAGLGRSLGDTVTFEAQGKTLLLRYSGYLAKRK